VSIFNLLRSFLTGRKDSLQVSSSILSYSESEASELEYSGAALRFVVAFDEDATGFEEVLAAEGFEEEAFGTLGAFETLGAEEEPSRSTEALTRGIGRCCLEGAV